MDQEEKERLMIMVTAHAQIIHAEWVMEQVKAEARAAKETMRQAAEKLGGDFLRILKDQTSWTNPN